MNYDPIRLEVFRNLLRGVSEEMGVTLCRTAFSPNIKERRDFSCALFTPAGELVAQDGAGYRQALVDPTVRRLAVGFDVVHAEDVDACRDAQGGGGAGGRPGAGGPGAG